MTTPPAAPDVPMFRRPVLAAVLVVVLLVGGMTALLGTGLVNSGRWSQVAGARAIHRAWTDPQAPADARLHRVTNRGGAVALVWCDVIQPGVLTRRRKRHPTYVAVVGLPDGTVWRTSGYRDHSAVLRALPGAEATLTHRAPGPPTARDRVIEYDRWGWDWLYAATATQAGAALSQGGFERIE